MLRQIHLGEQTDMESVACALFDYVVHIHKLPCIIIQIAIQGLWNKYRLV